MNAGCGRGQPSTIRPAIPLTCENVAMRDRGTATGLLSTPATDISLRARKGGHFDVTLRDRPFFCSRRDGPDGRRSASSMGSRGGIETADELRQ
jgi:hypothetical protein